jgi:2-C-methyl-D-erythritol 4-phosphate cytidylyltransferase
MGGGTPKQYLDLAGAPVLARTLAALAAHPAVHAIVVALSEDDGYFDDLYLACRDRVHRAPGGAERADSVCNALALIETRLVPAQPAGSAGVTEWALVHDAVRPCLSDADLDRLIATALASEHGALLAAPTRDTMKRVREARVVETVPRDDLWHALTPQMFPLAALRRALEGARAEGVAVTDESQAMERLGWRPAVVQGRADNIKITRPEDLALAALFLSPGEA